MTVHGHRRPDYVLTHDLGQRLQVLGSMGLNVPAADAQVVQDAQRQVREDMQEAVTDGQVISIQMGELADEVRGLAEERWPDAYFISACPEISVEGHGHQLEVSRLYGLRGEFMGVGPRPGFPSLIEQVDAISPEARARGIVILEDGIFSGATVEEIVNVMKARHVRPLGLVAGFTFERPRPVLETIERGGTKVVLARDIRNPVAWHPDRDFFPFLPGCGRVVGFTLNGRYRTNRFPLYTYNQATYAFPYLPQFSDSACLWANWTGLPDEAAETLGEHCMSNVRRLFEELEDLNGRTIHIGDLIGTSVRTSIPHRVGQSEFPSLERRVIDYLDELA